MGPGYPLSPNLVTVKHEGKTVDVVVQVTKDGNVYVLDRTAAIPSSGGRTAGTDTGIDRRACLARTEISRKALPFSKQSVSDSDITTLSPQAHAYVQSIFRQSEYGGKFLPPGTKGTLLVGYSGGAEWVAMRSTAMASFIRILIMLPGC